MLIRPGPDSWVVKKEEADFGVLGWEKGFVPCLPGSGQVRHQRHLVTRQIAESSESLVWKG